MEASYLRSGQEVLEYFQVEESDGLSDSRVQNAVEKYGRNGTRFKSHSLKNEEILIQS